MAELCRQFIGNIATIVGPSPEEEASVLNFDFSSLRH